MQVVALRVSEFFVRRQVHDEGHLGIIKTGVNAVLGFFVPVQVKNAADGPAISVNHAALQCGVHLAGRRCHHAGIERLKEVAVHRADADFLTRQIRLVDFLVGVNVKRLVFNHAGQVLHIAFFIPDLVDGIKRAVFTLFGHGDLRQL